MRKGEGEGAMKSLVEGLIKIEVEDVMMSEVKGVVGTKVGVCWISMGRKVDSERKVEDLMKMKVEIGRSIA